MNDPIRDEAQARHLAHVDHPTHRPLSEDYELVGLRGEQALAEEFGLTIDMVRRPNGDGGVDNVLCLSGKPYVVDVKCARKAYNLIVEQGKCQPQTIYVLARYHEEVDRASLIGWQWGALLLKVYPMSFGYGVLNHYWASERLRKIEELKERLTPPAQTFEHRCAVCSAPANFGFEVRLLKGEIGKWFCNEHRPDRGEKNG